MQPLELHSPSSPTTTTTTHSETSTAVDGVDPESYFATNDPPASLEEDAAKVFEFVERHRIDGKRVVLVTVRCNFLDNVSFAPDLALF